MLITKAEFIVSNTDYTKCPETTLPEFAFIGRSNVGKSSLINMLCNRNGLAKTSATPGKTQLINHFKINDAWYLVDLPGYGYAKISRDKRAEFDAMIKDYICLRKNLVNVFLLIDSRIPPQENDWAFMKGLAENAIAFSIVFTKTDSLTKTKLKKHIDVFETKLLETWETLPPCFITSSAKKEGRDDVLNYITACIKDYKS